MGGSALIGRPDEDGGLADVAGRNPPGVDVMHLLVDPGSKDCRAMSFSGSDV